MGALKPSNACAVQGMQGPSAAGGATMAAAVDAKMGTIAPNPSTLLRKGINSSSVNDLRFLWCSRLGYQARLKSS